MCAFADPVFPADDVGPEGSDDEPDGRVAAATVCVVGGGTSAAGCAATAGIVVGVGVAGGAAVEADGGVSGCVDVDGAAAGGADDVSTYLTIVAPASRQ